MLRSLGFYFSHFQQQLPEAAQQNRQSTDFYCNFPFLHTDNTVDALQFNVLLFDKFPFSIKLKFTLKLPEETLLSYMTVYFS